MGDNFAVRLAFKAASARSQSTAKLTEILDYPVMDQCDFTGGMGMRVGSGGGAVRGPAGMSDADDTGRGIARLFLNKIDELAFSPAADQLSVIHGAQARAIISAVFHAPETVDQTIRDVFLADDADDSTHIEDALPYRDFSAFFFFMAS